ncbi:MAG: hypothetical protein ACI91O_001042 [Candidatus Poriferisodalaceae bacterium]|jgi:uncharacterized protein (TIGR03083 family)
MRVRFQSATPTDKMDPMNTARQLDVFASQGFRINEIGAANDLDVVVPSCPEWTLGELIGHCAGLWERMRASIEAGERTDPLNGTPSDDVLAWHAESHQAMSDYLTSRAADDPCWTFVGPGSMSFWHRRMSNEVALHRWDAEQAATRASGGEPAPMDTDVALDAIDELFEFFVALRNPAAYAGNGETVHLHATDGHGEWVITRTAEGMEVEHAHAKSDVAARGPASDLLLMMWNRIGPGHLETFGQTELLDEWQRTVRF